MPWGYDATFLYVYTKYHDRWETKHLQQIRMNRIALLRPNFERQISSVSSGCLHLGRMRSGKGGGGNDDLVEIFFRQEERMNCWRYDDDLVGLLF